jgi:hypothetical protein
MGTISRLGNPGRPGWSGDDTAKTTGGKAWWRPWDRGIRVTHRLSRPRFARRMRQDRTPLFPRYVSEPRAARRQRGDRLPAVSTTTIMSRPRCSAAMAFHPVASRVAACPSSRGSTNRLGVPASEALFPVNQVKHFSRQPRFSSFNFLSRQRKTTLGNAGVSIESHIPRGSPRLTTGAVMPATFCTAGSGIRRRPACIRLVKLTGFWIDKGN